MRSDDLNNQIEEMLREELQDLMPRGGLRRGHVTANGGSPVPPRSRDQAIARHAQALAAIGATDDEVTTALAHARKGAA